MFNFTELPKSEGSKAADKNNPMGKTFLGIMYENGWHNKNALQTNKANFPEAFKLYSAAADAGYTEAQFRLGKFLNTI